jgi:hypothetical protein
VSMKSLVRRATVAATEPDYQACGQLEPRTAEACMHIGLRLRAVISDGERRGVVQNGDAR